MSSKVVMCSLFVMATLLAVLANPAPSLAAGKDVIVGKGSPTSKRVALTRFHGMPNAPRLRLAAVLAHQQASTKK